MSGSRHLQIFRIGQKYAPKMPPKAVICNRHDGNLIV